MRKQYQFTGRPTAWIMVLCMSVLLCLLPGTATAYFEDFESGAVGWTAEGTWALITDDYHSPDHCMTDSPEANYPADAYAALVSPYVQLPDTTPLVLTFWQHYSLADHYSTPNDDYGHVQISNDNGLSWSTIISYGGSVSTWNYEALDISDYSGQQVKIRFLLAERGTETTTDGWYIDDVTIPGDYVPDDEVIYGYSLEEDFESGAPDWILEGTWDFITSDYRSPTQCVTDSPDGDYPADADMSIITPPISLPADMSSILSYWQHYSLADHYATSNDDYGYIDVSTNFGVSWETLTYWTASRSTWHLHRVDLSAYSGQTIMIRFRLLERGTESTRDGWYIDDVTIENLMPESTPAPETTVSPPSGQYAVTQAFDLALIVGDSDCTGLDISATFNGTDVSSQLNNCLIEGTLASGGLSYRCPYASNHLSPGINDLSVTFDFDNCSSATETVEWDIVDNTEP